MTERKFTDDDVIKALECCAVDPHSGKFADCKNCPLDQKTANCFEYEIQIIALDLINRQRAEIERLKKLSDEGAECPTCHGVGKIGTTNWLTKDLSKKQIAKEKAESVAEFHRELKAEAIKEFAERVKEIKVKYGLPLLGLHTKTEIENYVDDILLQMRDGIDNLVKEMTEVKEQ